MRFALLLSSALTMALGPAPRDTYPRQAGIDVQHYRFGVALSDSTDRIDGETTVTIRFTHADITGFFLDLTSDSAGKGMTVIAVTERGAPLTYTHQRNHLQITLAQPSVVGATHDIVVRYRGVPAKGLWIGKNRQGDRAFFSRNWSENARQWLPTVDHPSDKATSEFIVTAPAKYSVVANGLLQKVEALPDGAKRTHWRQKVPTATWLNNIGVAEFAMHEAGLVKGIPLQTWVPKQDSAKMGNYEDVARKAITFYSDSVGPYSYEKLANVAAAGGGGGMEHASAIFYGEITSDAVNTSLLAHEIAHQWFGDAVTEEEWNDVWLSEGFATYFSMLYTEHYAGRDAFVAALDRSRPVTLRGESQNKAVVHDNPQGTGPDLSQVYQKGSWVLHMLDQQVGRPAFWKGIRAYYREHRDKSATTADFQRAMERASGQDLGWFFDQWLTRTRSPALEGSWRYDAAQHQVVLELAQVHEGEMYRLPLEVALAGASGAPRIVKIEMTAWRQRFTMPAAAEPASLTLDPNVNVLMSPPQLTRR